MGKGLCPGPEDTQNGSIHMLWLSGAGPKRVPDANSFD